MWPGDAGSDASASYTEGGGRNGNRLTHHKAGAYQVYTAQTVTGLSPGTYRARAGTVRSVDDVEFVRL